MKKIDNKLDALKEETAQEYLQPIKQLNEDYKQALKICDILKDLRLKLVEVRLSFVKFLVKLVWSEIVTSCCS